MQLPLPDYGKPIRVGDPSFVYRGVYHPIIWHGEDPYRPRVETIVVSPTGTSVFLRRYKPSPDHRYNYRLPGGSLDNDSDKMTQAKNEVNEEALLAISDIWYTNIQYFEQYPDGFLLKHGDIPIAYKGTFNDVYVAKYKKRFDRSKVSEHDLDDDMATNGKFYKILDVYKELRPEHVDAILTTPLVNDLVKRYIRLGEIARTDVMRTIIPESGIPVSEMIDIHSLIPVPKNVRLFHGSPVQGITQLKAFHDDRIYPEYGPVVFVSPYKEFAACYGTRWDDTTMKQYVKDTIDGVSVQISLVGDVPDWNQPCSLYELRNEGFLYYLPGHPHEIIGKGPLTVKREEKFDTFWDMVKKYNICIQDVNTGQPISSLIDERNRIGTPSNVRRVLKDGGFYDADGVWNSIVQVDDKLYRGRVETLVFNGGKLYIQLVDRDDNDNGTRYRIPGGSLEKGIPNQEQAHAECMEEARLLIKNCRFSGITYTEITGMPTWAKGIGSPVEWVGKYNEVYYAEFYKIYTGYIKQRDRDDIMLKDGKFIPIEDIYNILIPEHQKVVDMYIADKF